MSYTRHEWVSKETITADLLNNMEQGIQDANDSIPDVSNYVTTDTLSNYATTSSLNSYVVKDITSDAGTAKVWNEATGGGLKFNHTDGTEAFVGVNNGGESGYGVQIYFDKQVDNNWEGTALNVYYGGIYYHASRNTGDSSYKSNDPDREIAVKGDLTELLNRISELETKVAALEAAAGS